MPSNTLNAINKNIEENAVDYIAQAETAFDDMLNNVVDEILENSDCDIVLLAGPSSSGKTTTANKLVGKIRARNRNSLRVSLDDFYLNRDQIPITEDGIKDFENITALDIEFIHKTFRDLIENRKAQLPLFDFTTGMRKEETVPIELGKNDVIIVEGIHALNPKIAEGLGSNHVLKTYISVSSRIIEDDGRVLLNKRNLRFIRRMIRDYNYRSCPVENTFLQWPGVMKGEDKYLFPYESNADIKINSFHAYEPCLFKSDALDLLDDILPDSLYYENAQELIHKLEPFCAVDSSLLPENSLLREFMTQ